MKKALSLLLVLALVLGAFGFTAFADELEVEEEPTFTVGSEPGMMTIVIKGDFDEKDWVGIYKAGETTDPDNGGMPSLVWWYLGENGCEVQLPATEDVFYNRYDEFILNGMIIPGEYMVAVLANDGYEPKEGYESKFIKVESTAVEDENADKKPYGMAFLNKDEYDDFFGIKNAIEDISFDSEKQCYVASVYESNDPFVELCFETLVLYGELDDLNVEDVQVISIGVRFDHTAANELEFYYQTDEYPGYSEPQKVISSYEGHDGYQYVTIDLRQTPNWEGNLLNCRYDVFRSSNKECQLEIYYVGLFKSMAGAVDFGESWLAVGGGANNPLANVEPDETPDTGATAEPGDDPTAEPADPTTEPKDDPTEEPAAPTDVPADDATEAPDGDEKPVDKDQKKKGGCGGMLSGLGLIAVAGAALAALKKKH